MKNRLFPFLLLLGAGLMSLLIPGAAFGQGSVIPPPSGAWDPCNDGTNIYAHWNGTGPVLNSDSTWSSNYSTHPELAIITITHDTLVRVKVPDAYIATNWKHIFFYIQGTGSTGSPTNPKITFYPHTGKAEDIKIEDMQINAAKGNWFITASGWVVPQPDSVAFTFTVPGTPAITGGWFMECCRTYVPTLTEWGLIIFSLLILTMVTVVVVRRRTVAVAAGANVSATVPMPLMTAGVFWKVLACTETLAVIGLGITGAVSGSLALRDIIGTLVSAAIVAYMVHLWIGPKRE